MKDLIEINEQNETITLKQITDFEGSRHNDAKTIVERLAKEDGFGILRTTRSINSRKREIETYELDKRQSIAVMSRLNTKFLMALVDRWILLETNKTLALEIKNSEQIAEIESGYSVSQYEKDREISNLEKIINQYSSAEDFKDPRKAKRMPLIFKVHGKTLHLGMCNKSEALKWKSKFREFVNETDEMDIHKIRDLFYVQETRKHFVPYHSCLDQ